MTEADEIIANAQSAYRSGELTAEEYRDVTRVPLMDKELEAE